MQSSTGVVRLDLEWCCGFIHPTIHLIVWPKKTNSTAFEAGLPCMRNSGWYHAFFMLNIFYLQINQQTNWTENVLSFTASSPSLSFDWTLVNLLVSGNNVIVNTLMMTLISQFSFRAIGKILFGWLLFNPVSEKWEKKGAMINIGSCMLVIQIESNCRYYILNRILPADRRNEMSRLLCW